jgi:alcohol dehydrogenase (cytochrome c)
MRYPITALFVSTALLSAPGLTGHAQAPAPTPSPKPTPTGRTVSNFVPVTEQAMRAPKPEDWLMYRGNYQGWGYSPLEQINKANVKNLQLAWSRVMAPGSNQATPIIYNGVMYLGNPGDVIQAIDAANGDLIWDYRHPLPPATSLHNNQGQKKRGIVLYGGTISSSLLRPVPARWRGRPSAAATDSSPTRAARSSPTAWSSRAARAIRMAAVMSPVTTPGTARNFGAMR